MQLQRNSKDMHPVSLEIENQEATQSYLTDAALKAKWSIICIKKKRKKERKKTCFERREGV